VRFDWASLRSTNKSSLGQNGLLRKQV